MHQHWSYVFLALIHWFDRCKGRTQPILWTHTCSWYVIKWKNFPRYWPFVRGIPVTGEFLTQRPVTRRFDVFFDLHLNKRLSKHSWGWWFGTPSRPLWHHRNVSQYFSLSCGLLVVYCVCFEENDWPYLSEMRAIQIPRKYSFRSVLFI